MACILFAEVPKSLSLFTFSKRSLVSHLARTIARNKGQGH